MTYPRTDWRIIQTAPAPGAWNMAVDEAILEAVGRGEVTPTLRLYAWSPPCLSIGYAQPIADVDFTRLFASGWEIVRRPTGGRSILHTDELTYSVIGPHSDPRLECSLLESYQRLSTALIHALRLLGVPAEALELPNFPSGPKSQNPVCFEVPSHYEITVRGKKLIGSAQARRRESVLQHGSLPLYGDLTRILQALRFPDDNDRSAAAERLLARATTVEGILGYRLDWKTVVAAFETAFEKILNLKLIHSNLTAGEQARANELVQEKYTHFDWTERV